MTVYVDDLRTWNGRRWCNLVATNESELDMFAMLKLGLRPRWRQSTGGYLHYDLRPALREVALRRGAKYIPTEELLKRVRGRRET
jgi:hypothetical protein